MARPAHPPEVRRRAFELLTAGEPTRKVAAALGIGQGTVGGWRKLWFADAGAGEAGPAHGEADEPGGTVELAPNPADASGYSDDEQARLEDAGWEAPGPPPIDRLYLEAMHRFVNLLQNGVAVHQALYAVRFIDPDFDISDQAAIALLQGLGMTQEPVKLSEQRVMNFATTAPPSYVTNVYDRFEMGDPEIKDLAYQLQQLAQESYLEGINAQLTKLGASVEDAITDPAVLALIEDQSLKRATGIADTYNRMLANAAYTQYIDLRSVEGTQSSEYKLEEAVANWSEDVADWKSEQVALTEVNYWYNSAAQDFIEQNPDLADGLTGYVTPDECACEGCQDLVDMGDQPAEVLNALELPLHPGCVHGIEWNYPDAAATDDLWTGQSDEEDQASSEEAG